MVPEKNIETERLFLRRLLSSDADDLFKTVGDSEVLKYWIGGADKDIFEVGKRIACINEHWNKYGFGDWGVFSKITGELIGFAGLHYIDNIKEVNIGYALKKSEWRKGFAFEMCRGILEYAFDILNFEEIVAVIQPDNIASIKLIEKCGFNSYKNIIWKDNNRIVYRMTDNGYEKRK